MAQQQRVTAFFNSRKRNGDIHPSKRRKVQRLTEFDQQTEEIPPILTSPISARTRKKGLPAVNINLNTPAQLQDNTETPTSQSKSTTKRKPAKTRKCKLVAPDSSLNNIRDVIKGLGGIQSNVVNSQKESEGSPSDSKEPSIIEETTAACDDHVASPPSTPRKRSNKTEIAVHNKKRSRPSKTKRKDLFQTLQKTPDAFNFTPYAESSESEKSSETSERKILVSRRSGSTSETECAGKASPVFKFLGNKNEEAAAADSRFRTKQKLVTKALSEATPVVKEAKTTISKEATSSFNVDSAKAHTKPDENSVTKARSNEEVKQKSLNAAEIKSKLAKCGKLEELKQQLAAFSKASAQVKVTKQPSKSKTKEAGREKAEVEAAKPQALETQSTAKVPAYQKYHSLAIPVPPTLSLPFKYKVLAEMFHSMDTVVNILSKRQEICTFTKLKLAVQNMMRKAFEVYNVGQIKTVYPDAYYFRQEKGLPVFGGKQSGYQLTVEANLEQDKSEKDTKQKPIYTAQKLLDRKSFFHRSLIDIVKGHHKEFLQRLERPLTIPDDKITRWHPKFPLDQVPDIEPAELPEPPDAKKLSTASEVLDQARGKIASPRVQKALEMVAKRSEANRDPAASPVKSNIAPKPAAETPNAGLKGVPQSLLERIRAKEAQKLEAAMTRTPENIRRLEMISRLPELVRILRSFFVTQKKPALLMHDVVQKLSDSYKTTLGQAEAERHLKLMVELLPGYIQVISVKKGTFLKLDKNKDINGIVDKLEKMKKQQT